MKRISNNRGSIQLKFTTGGRRYSLNPLPSGKYEHPHDLATVNAIITRIENDIQADNFDTTLDRYRIGSKVAESANTPKTKPKGITQLVEAVRKAARCF